MFAMPHVQVGQWVHWYPGADRSAAPQAALVTKVNKKNLGILVFKDFQRNAVPVQGVLHRDDPGLIRQALRGNGCWEHSPDTTMVLEMAQKLDELGGRLALLEAELGSPTSAD